MLACWAECQLRWSWNAIQWIQESICFLQNKTKNIWLQNASDNSLCAERERKALKNWNILNLKNLYIWCKITWQSGIVRMDAALLPVLSCESAIYLWKKTRQVRKFNEKTKLNYRFHNPNTDEVMANYLCKILVQANAEKARRVIEAAKELNKEELELASEFWKWFEYIELLCFETGANVDRTKRKGYDFFVYFGIILWN